MKFLMSPGRSVGGGGNQYINILCNALGSYGVSIHDWKPYIPFQCGAGFHLHWPEIFPIKIFHQRQKYIEPLIQYNLWKTIDDVKKHNHKLIWTVHNLQPHNAAFAEDAHWHKFIDRFSDAVDSYILLTPAARDDVLRAYPRLKDKNWGVAHHPHYRDVLAPSSANDCRLQHGIAKETIVVGMLGSMNAAKGVIDIIDSFVSARLPDCILFLAGKADEASMLAIETARASGADIRGVFRHLSDQEISDFYQMLDMTIFPSTSHLNSGTVLHSLSCNVPVRLRRTPTNVYLASQIGASWLSFIEDKIIDESLISDVLRRRANKSLICNLSAFDPAVVAKQHIDIYFPEGLPK
ncbi:MAG: hypothetical protein PHD48_06715 [Alphaproteobacteria bacterium]|nr:hypothetical protein [Alphaproteobacteria bacterium]